MMTLYINKTAYSVTARERAPKAANREMFSKNGNLSRTGMLYELDNQSENSN